MNDSWSPIARVYDPLKAGSIDGTDTEPHDHGVVRAMEVEYRPYDCVTNDPKLTIFVARLNPQTTEETIKKFFSTFGKIKRCHLIRDIVTGFSKRYAFVEYKDRISALEAHRRAYRAELDGNSIFVDFECSRTLPGWVPRRLGGGFGGKKESGQLRFGGRDRPFKKPILLTPKNAHEHKRDDSDSARDRDGVGFRGTYNDRSGNGEGSGSYNRYEERSSGRKRKHKKHHSRSRSRSRSRERRKDKHKKKRR